MAERKVPGKKIFYTDKPKNRALTTREEEVLEWAAKGRADKQVAEDLDMRPRTAEKHWEKIRKKLGVQSRGGAIYLYFKQLLDRKTQLISELQKENTRLRRRLARKKRAT